MNPYLAVTLAMCVIIILSLAATAYLAVVFNRRARADMDAALSPLAAVIDGRVDVDEATVRGRYEGHLTEGRVTTAPMGGGRTFTVALIDGAGGTAWSWTLAGKPGEEPPPQWESREPSLAESIRPAVEAAGTRLRAGAGWVRIEYDPAPGHVRVSRPMRTRRDIPSADIFREQVAALKELADLNRRVQNPDA